MKPQHTASKSSPDHEDSKERILARLRSALGHLRGVEKMIQDDDYCVDVLQQTKAVHAALSKVETLLLDRHLRHCVTVAVRSDKPSERERVIGELLDVFQAAGKSR